MQRIPERTFPNLTSTREIKVNGNGNQIAIACGGAEGAWEDFQSVDLIQAVSASMSPKSFTIFFVGSEYPFFDSNVYVFFVDTETMLSFDCGTWNYVSF